MDRTPRCCRRRMSRTRGGDERGKRQDRVHRTHDQLLERPAEVTGDDPQGAAHHEPEAIETIPPASEPARPGDHREKMSRPRESPPRNAPSNGRHRGQVKPVRLGAGIGRTGASIGEHDDEGQPSDGKPEDDSRVRLRTNPAATIAAESVPRTVGSVDVVCGACRGRRFSVRSPRPVPLLQMVMNPGQSSLRAFRILRSSAA